MAAVILAAAWASLAAGQPQPGGAPSSAPAASEAPAEVAGEPATSRSPPAVPAPVARSPEASPASAPDAARQPPDVEVVYSIIALVSLVAIVSLLIAARALAKSPGWTLGGVLSEEADLTDAQGTPIRVMQPSSSRTVAFVGSIVMLSLYFGFGLVGMYYFASDQPLPTSIKAVEKFMFAGLALFAPYAVNQISNAVTTITGGRRASAVILPNPPKVQSAGLLPGRPAGAVDEGGG